MSAGRGCASPEPEPEPSPARFGACLGSVAYGLTLITIDNEKELIFKLHNFS